jgi:phosphoribosylglycinamide formyltransferase-1
VSGQGSNLQALISAGRDPGYPARVVIACANRPAPALDHARSAGIEAAVFLRADFPSRDARDQAMAAALKARSVELVVCAGYDAILSPAFTRRFPGRIVNVHPSLLPDFKGSMDAVELALSAGVSETGCTVHLVTDDVDAGPILGQRRVPVLAGDTPARLHARIKTEEHRLLPEIVRQMAARETSLRR